MHRKKRMFAEKLIHKRSRNLWISLRYAIRETLRNVDFTTLLTIWKSAFAWFYAKWISRMFPA